MIPPKSITILVVDDEPSVCQIAGLALRRVGYEVLEAPSGVAALAILDVHPEVGLVILDCRMPHMSGPQLARAIMSRWPGIKLIAMSGEPRSPEMPEIASFIPKPFRPSTLLLHLQERLCA